MPTFRALYTDYPWADVEIERKLLAEVDCELIASPDNSEETQARMAPGIDVILTCWAPVTARVIDAADRCRHIARTGIGLDNINVQHATERGIVVTNVPDYCINEVAEHTLGLIYALGRGIAGYHLATKNGQYDLVAGLPAERISGKTLGIIGLGQIGKILAGAALDVQTPEPPDLSQSPYNDPRVIVTPHVAFYSSQATEELRTRVGRQVVAFLRGERPENIVNPAVLR
jgi:D-3-phosphoglycerate dehydrogenase